ncbi:MAG: exosortase system-associated protein, TIGR04073 family [Opitutaceae bacterium]|nr:exosortase system-associated protein, TIGR04073 family [Verrucomicrobiales bacterium]
MRISASFLAFVAAIALFSVGCAGPEAKLGRGINNATEFARLGEIQKSMEATALFDNPDTARTTGFIRGFNRSLARTAVGIYEIVTFPIPSYDPIYKPANTVYPSSYKPGLPAGPLFDTDASLGFSGGDVAPMIPGSKFRVFSY